MLDIGCLTVRTKKQHRRRMASHIIQSLRTRVGTEALMVRPLESLELVCQWHHFLNWFRVNPKALVNKRELDSQIVRQ